MRTAEPAAEVVVSWFESKGPASCAWMQLAVPDLEPTEIARIPDGCEDPGVYVGPGESVLLLINGDPYGRCWHVTPGHSSPVPPPPRGSARRYGFSKTGDVVLLSMLDLGGSDFEVAPDGSVRVDGVVVPGVDYVHEGQPALAEAWKLTDGAWVRVDSRQTDDGWDLAIGVDVLGVDLLPRAVSLRYPAVGPEHTADPRLGGEPFTLELPTQAGHVDFTVSAPWADGDLPGRILPARIGTRTFEPRDGAQMGIVLLTRGPWLLVEAGLAPVELVDLRTYETVWSSSEAHATTFWPPLAER